VIKIGDISVLSRPFSRWREAGDAVERQIQVLERGQKAKALARELGEAVVPEVREEGKVSKVGAVKKAPKKVKLCLRSVK
jgi:hypothetical protein